MSIPKIINQLWIGDRPRPVNAMNSIRDMNPSYKYMLWNEESIKANLVINPKYKRKIEEHSAIWGQADMYRYLILEQFGGIFIDADMVAVEPLDDFLLNEAFFCWENETARPDLCATSLQGYPPHHIIPQTAIKWIMDNNVNVEKTKIQSWVLVGPGLLTKTYHELIPDKSVVSVMPSYLGLPDHHSGSKYKGHGKVYMSHEWGSTKDNYKDINKMDIPAHHKKPKHSIDIYIPKDIKTKQLKEVVQGIKNMIGHFIIKISYEGDLTKYLKNMRFVEHKQYEMTNDGLVGVEEIITEFKEFDTRNDMISHYANMIDKPKLLELGVFKGEFLEYMETKMDYGSIDGVDLFEGNLYSGNVDGNNPEYTQLEEQLPLLNDKYKDNEKVNLHKSFTESYLREQKDDTYDIIYIDADHSYAGVKKDILLSYEKIKNGGYIMGHDYEMNMDKADNYYNFGTKQAVDEFCEEFDQTIMAKGYDGCVSFCIQVSKQ